MGVGGVGGVGGHDGKSAVSSSSETDYSRIDELVEARLKYGGGGGAEEGGAEEGVGNGFRMDEEQDEAHNEETFGSAADTHLLGK